MAFAACVAGMIRVKICGLRTPEALDASAAADWIGLNFFARSPRHVTPAEAAALLHGRHMPRVVGLFVDPTDAEVLDTLAQVRLDVLQLYAAEPRVAALRALTGLETWRAAGIASRADLPATTEADALVIESRPPPGADRPGGNGCALDWSLTGSWAAPGPWLLAGGLTPANVGDALARSGAAAVDVSSGVESSRGVKDAALIRDFLEAARRSPTAGR